MLQTYREGREEILDSVAQPYDLEVLRKVGWDLCWLYRDVLQTYREGREEILDSVAQPYDLEVLRKVGWEGC